MPKTKTQQRERIVQKRQFPAGSGNKGDVKPRTVYRGAETGRFYKKAEWQAQFATNS